MIRVKKRCDVSWSISPNQLLRRRSLRLRIGKIWNLNEIKLFQPSWLNNFILSYSIVIIFNVVITN